MIISDDTLVVTQMNRFGRNTVQLLRLVEQLREQAIYLVILNYGGETEWQILNSKFKKQ
ncbi:recombinase family protein [Peribacillus asahii]|uniref:recombinase family protein n=1 Tax=Peribacillus asahii TaxID=228899 RepID=UPI00380EBC86